MSNIHEDESSNENSNLIGNVMTAKSGPRGIFSLNDTGLFGLNIMHYSRWIIQHSDWIILNAILCLNVALFTMNNAIIFSLNNPVLFRPNRSRIVHVSRSRLSSRSQLDLSFHLNLPLFMYILYTFMMHGWFSRILVKDCNSPSTSHIVYIYIQEVELLTR